jgi:DNA-binding NarL/FixJ family response regulator
MEVMTADSEGKATPKRPAQRRVRRILLVDDHPMLRRGLAELISHEPDLGICGEADSASAAMQEVQEKHPDLAIVDISLHDLSGLELIKQIKARYEKLKILVCSMHDEKIYAERALRAGALGYISKEEAAKNVVTAIRRVLKNEVYLSDEMAGTVLQQMREGKKELDGSSVDRLTDREIEVFELIGQGLSTREIASRLHLSVKTIDAHRQKIKNKLKLSNSNELVQHAVKWVLEQA